MKPWERYQTNAIEPTQGKPWEKYAAVEQPTKEPEIAAGLVGKLGQGATFGLADELQAGLFALPRYIGNEIRGQEDATLGGAYDQLLNEQRANLQAAQEQYPTTSTVAEIAGGLGTLGGLGAGTKVGRAIYGAGAKGLAPAAVTKLGKAANMASKIGIGAGTGAATVGAYGFGTGEGGAGKRLDEAKSNAILGATVGGSLPLATTGLGAVGLALAPKIDEGLREVGKLAQKYNIPVSLDQLTSSRSVKSAQKVSQDIPFSGQAGFQEKQREAWQAAVAKTFGAEGKRLTPELADESFTRLGKQFDMLGKGKTISVGGLVNNIDKKIIQDSAYSGLTQETKDSFNKYLKDKLLPNILTGEIKGEVLNKIRTDVNGLARKVKDPALSELYRDLENELIDTLTEGSGVAAQAFKKTKQQYKNLLAVEPLFTKGRGGIANPSLLNSRVEKIYGRAYTKGQAGELGDLARIGRDLLPELGGSDTQAKLLTSGIIGSVGTGAALGSAAPAVLAGTTMAANRGLQAINRNQALIGRLLNKEAGASKELLKMPPVEANAILQEVKRVQPTINLKNTKK